MKYWYQNPPPSIKEYVRTILTLEGSSTPADTQLPLFTNGMPALVYHAKKKNNTVPCITLFGTAVPSEKWNVQEDDMLIAYFFKPFALGTVFNISAKDLKEKSVPLDEWDAQKFMALNIQLAHVHDGRSRIETLNHFIAGEVQNNLRECEIIRRVTDEMMIRHNTKILSKILDDLGLTERTFQRIFKKYVGVTPNQYRRICQFHFAFSQLKGQDFEKLTDVTYNNGYFDQSHYIRSFKEFTNITPNEYLQKGLPKTD